MAAAGRVLRASSAAAAVALSRRGRRGRCDEMAAANGTSGPAAGRAAGVAATVTAAAVTAAAGGVGLRRVPRDPRGGGGPAVRPLAVPRLRPTRCRRGRPALPALPRPRAGWARRPGPRRPGRPTRRCWAGAPAAAHRSAAARVGTGARPAGPRPGWSLAPRPRSQVELSLLPLGSGAEAAAPGLACLEGGGSQAPTRAGVKSSRGVGTGLCGFQFVFLNFELRNEVQAR